MWAVNKNRFFSRAVMQKEIEKCWLCKKRKLCPFECTIRPYCSGCFGDHCDFCHDCFREYCAVSDDVHRTNDIVDSKMKVYASRKAKEPLILTAITEIVSIRSDGSRSQIGDIIMKIDDLLISSYRPDMLQRMLNDAERHNFEVISVETWKSLEREKNANKMKKKREKSKSMKSSKEATEEAAKKERAHAAKEEKKRQKEAARKADAVNIDVKEFIELYEANTDFITCAVCGIEGPRYNSVLIKDHPEVKPPLQALFEEQIKELRLSGKSTDAIFADVLNENLYGGLHKDCNEICKECYKSLKGYGGKFTLSTAKSKVKSSKENRQRVANTVRLNTTSRRNFPEFLKVSVAPDGFCLYESCVQMLGTNDSLYKKYKDDIQSLVSAVQQWIKKNMDAVVPGYDNE